MSNADGRPESLQPLASPHTFQRPSLTRFFGIQGRLIVVFCATFALVALTVEAIRLWGIPGTPLAGLANEYHQEAKRNLDLIADIKEERLTSWLADRRRDLRILASDQLHPATFEPLERELRGIRLDQLSPAEVTDAIRELPGRNAAERWIHGVIRQYPEYERILILDVPTGNVVASSRPADVGLPRASRLYFRGALASQGEYVSPVVPRLSDGLPVMYFSQPIDVRDGAAAAVLAIEVNVDAVLKPVLLGGPALGQRGEALLVNQDCQTVTTLKNPLADGSMAKPLEYQIQAEPARRAARGESGSIEALDYRGEPVLASYRHVRVSPEVGWGLVVKRDRAEVDAPLRDEFRRAVLLLGFGLLLSIGVIWLAAWGVTRRLRALGGAAAQVAGGNLAVRANTKGNDEVALLAAAFNNMVDELCAAQELLVRQERLAALGQLTASVSHELRNPLGTIRTSLYLVKQKAGGTNPTVCDALNRAERAIGRCDAIIRDLLDYGRNRPLERQLTDVDAWLAGVLDEWTPPAGVRLETDLAAQATISLDREHMERCILNLITNASHALPPEGGLVRVSTRVDGDWLRLSVRDNGCGIAEEHLSKIFEPLFSTKTFGVGLGLAIVRRAAVRHGGRVDVESRLGQGATFMVLIPLAPPEEVSRESTEDLRRR